MHINRQHDDLPFTMLWLGGKLSHKAVQEFNKKTN